MLDELQNSTELSNLMHRGFMFKNVVILMKAFATFVLYLDPDYTPN
jgi:hypothetical protein